MSDFPNGYLTTTHTGDSMPVNRFTLYDDSKYENHTTNELHLEGSSIEEAVKQYIKDYVSLKFPTSDAKLKETDIRAAFLAGSEWQKEKDIRDMLMSDCRNFEKCYELGKKDLKEQMMNDAITADIGYYNQHGLSIYPEKNLEKLGFDEHDKVKIVVIKEE